MRITPSFFLAILTLLGTRVRAIVPYRGKASDLPEAKLSLELLWHLYHTHDPKIAGLDYSQITAAEWSVLRGFVLEGLSSEQLEQIAKVPFEPGFSRSALDNLEKLNELRVRYGMTTKSQQVNDAATGSGQQQKQQQTAESSSSIVHPPPPPPSKVIPVEDLQSNKPPPPSPSAPTAIPIQDQHSMPPPPPMPGPSVATTPPLPPSMSGPSVASKPPPPPPVSGPSVTSTPPPPPPPPPMPTTSLRSVNSAPKVASKPPPPPPSPFKVASPQRPLNIPPIQQGNQFQSVNEESEFEGVQGALHQQAHLGPPARRPAGRFSASMRQQEIQDPEDQTMAGGEEETQEDTRYRSHLWVGEEDQGNVDADYGMEASAAAAAESSVYETSTLVNPYAQTQYGEDSNGPVGEMTAVESQGQSQIYAPYDEYDNYGNIVEGEQTYGSMPADDIVEGEQTYGAMPADDDVVEGEQTYGAMPADDDVVEGEQTYGGMSADNVIEEYADGDMPVDNTVEEYADGDMNAYTAFEDANNQYYIQGESDVANFGGEYTNAEIQADNVGGDYEDYAVDNEQALQADTTVDNVDGQAQQSTILTTGDNDDDDNLPEPERISHVAPSWFVQLFPETNPVDLTLEEAARSADLIQRWTSTETCTNLEEMLVSGNSVPPALMPFISPAKLLRCRGDDTTRLINGELFGRVMIPRQLSHFKRPLTVAERGLLEVFEKVWREGGSEDKVRGILEEISEAPPVVQLRIKQLMEGMRRGSNGWVGEVKYFNSLLSYCRTGELENE